MKFGRVTDNDFGKNPLNFGHDRDHDLDLRSGRNTFSFKNVTCCFKSITCWSCGHYMMPLQDAATSFRRTFGHERKDIQRLTSVSRKQYRGTERRMAQVVYSFNIYYCGISALWVPFFLVPYVSNCALWNSSMNRATISSQNIAKTVFTMNCIHSSMALIKSGLAMVRTGILWLVMSDTFWDRWFPGLLLPRWYALGFLKG